MITYIVKSEGVDPPVFKSGGSGHPRPPVGDAPATNMYWIVALLFCIFVFSCLIFSFFLFIIFSLSLSTFPFFFLVFVFTFLLFLLLEFEPMEPRPSISMKLIVFETEKQKKANRKGEKSFPWSRYLTDASLLLHYCCYWIGRKKTPLLLWCRKVNVIF